MRDDGVRMAVTPLQTSLSFNFVFSLFCFLYASCLNGQVNVAGEHKCYFSLNTHTHTDRHTPPY